MNRYAPIALAFALIFCAHAVLANSSNFYVSSTTGDVGVGTASPINALDVYGGVAIGTSYAGTDTAPSNGLLVQGNVGIGTPTPLGLLHVSGAGNYVNYVDSYTGSGNAGTGLVIRQARGTAAAPSATQSGDELTFVNGRGYGASGFEGGSSAGIGYYAAENFTDTTRAGYMILSTTPSGGGLTERMRIDQNGNVGIGTTSPLNSLEVYDGVIEGAQLGIGVTSTDGLLLSNTTAATSSVQQYSPRVHFSGQGWKTNSTASSELVDFIEEAQPSSGASAPTGNLVWSNSINGGSYSALMTLTSGGNVGIGTTAPLGLLHVSGAGNYINYVDSYTGSGSTGTGLVIRQARGTAVAPSATQSGDELTFVNGRGYGASGFEAGSSAGIGYYAAENFTDTTRAGYMILFTTPSGGGLTERMRIDQNGNVGIGTSSPLNSSVLDARGIISANGLISNGTKFTVGTCTASSTVGGATAGKIVTSNASGCVITLGGLTAPNGWSYVASDISASAAVPQTATSTTTCTLAAVTSTHTIVFQAMAF